MKLEFRCQHLLVAGLLCFEVFGPACEATAQLNKHLDPLSWDRNVAGLVARYCYGCHNENQTKGDVNLARDVNPRLIMEHRDVWETAQGVIEAELMPPPKAKQPTEEERKIMVDFLTQLLGEVDCSSVQDPGPSPVRRLNNKEYNNTIRRLTGLDLSPADTFPPDPTSYGFDNIGAALSFSPTQVEQYHKAATEITDCLLKQTPQVNGWPEVLLPAGFTPGESHRQTAQAITERFATRAFRRPVEPAYVERLMEVYDLAVERGDSPQQSLGHLLTAILSSPRFLIRLEANRPDEVEPYPIDDYELASRLSYFLWSGPPDDELLELAASGKLSEPEILDQQTRRMLRDEKSIELVRNFFGQWLELNRLKTHQPDSQIFPEFNGDLRNSMNLETELFLQGIVSENRPIRELIDSNYIYVDQRLAEWYGIPNVTGTDFQRVELPDRRRGGILTSAAVLMLQADPDRTNIPRRGNYIAGRILGDAPPPPPPDVPALPADNEEVKMLTLRERLEQHREKVECSGCHGRIDPLGFALENYDALGRWRDQENGHAIDPSGELPDGRKIANVDDFKTVLLENEDRFARTFINHLVIYALGRPIQSSDECVLRDLRNVAKNQEGRFGDLVVALVRSPLFLTRRNPE